MPGDRLVGFSSVRVNKSDGKIHGDIFRLTSKSGAVLCFHVYRYTALQEEQEAAVLRELYSRGQNFLCKMF